MLLKSDQYITEFITTAAGRKSLVMTGSICSEATVRISVMTAGVITAVVSAMSAVAAFREGVADRLG
jgi:hypothetical protein